MMDAHQSPPSSPPSLEFLTSAQGISVRGDLTNVAGNHTVNQTINYNHIHNSPPATQLQKEALNALHDGIARNAMHDGDQQAEKLEFHPETRKSQRMEMISWVLDPQRPENVLWLKGVTGTGKSALLKRISDAFYNGEVDGCLAASFFFLREDPTRNHPSKFAATISYRLAVSFPEVGKKIGAAIARDRTLLTAEIAHQWAVLVVKPVKEAIKSTLPAVIVIDGLDQCGTVDDQCQILKLISSCGPDFPIAFVIASCPEPHLLAAFEGDLGHAGMHHRAIELGDGEEARTEMKVFLDHSFSSIRKKHPMVFSPGDEWPDEQTIGEILNWAAGRYLLLSMIVQSVRSSKDPRAALQEYLDKAPTKKKTVTLQKLVVSIDIGTTYSGVSYSIIDPSTGAPPKIRSVTRFPGQHGSGGDPRIPSVVIYDQLGNVKAVGAEADSPALQVKMRVKKWFKAYWFKLHLRPKDLAPAGIVKDIPPLPPNKTVTVVFADFLRYIVGCTQKFIVDSHIDGATIWESPKEFILTHPNGWGAQQQFQMREAAVMAEIVPNSPDGRERVRFVTEGEACLHYCITNNVMPRNSSASDSVVIIDAGGGTIDTSAYRRRKEDEASYEEITIPQCFLQGSVIVTQRAHSHLEEYLAGSKYCSDIPGIVSSFDKTTKLTFRDSDETEYTCFAREVDNDEKYNIEDGMLMLNGSMVAGFFEPSIKCMESVIKQSHLEHRIKTVLLVGGFAANEWVFKSLKTTFSPLGVSIYRPDHHMAKAVADGAVSHFLKSYVKARITRCALGSRIQVPYDSKNPEHVLRKSKLQNLPDGTQRFEGGFEVIIPKNTQVAEEQQYRRSYHVTALRLEQFETINNQSPIPIYGYYGDLTKPQWMDESPNDYRVIGRIPVDLTNVDVKRLVWKLGDPPGNGFYMLSWEVILFTGLTELKAQIGWKDSWHGEIKQRSPMYVLCDKEQLDNL